MMKGYRILKEDDIEALHQWWQMLQENRGERAQLRRAQSPDDVLLTPAFAQFLRHMPGYWGVDPGNFGIVLSDAAMVAAVLARVQEQGSQNFARALALPKEGSDKAAMSELRFQQLQKSHTPDDFFIRLCRAINMLGGKVDIISLADGILHWLKEYHFAPASRPQHRLAVRWASEYYQALKD